MNADASPLGTDHTDTPLWVNGWWAQAQQRPSPNWGPRPAGKPISLAVVHSISLPPGEYGTGCVQALFTNQLDWEAHPYFQHIRGLEVSAHFFIDRQGKTTQFVSVEHRAWHAGRSSWQGQDNCNDYSVGIELEGLEGLTFEPGQYTALVKLLEALRSAWPTLQHIAGHEHVAPGRKQDPGPGFDWGVLHQQLQNWPPSAWAVPPQGNDRS